MLSPGLGFYFLGKQVNVSKVKVQGICLFALFVILALCCLYISEDHKSNPGKYKTNLGIVYFIMFCGPTWLVCLFLSWVQIKQEGVTTGVGQPTNTPEKQEGLTAGVARPTNTPGLTDLSTWLVLVAFSFPIAIVTGNGCYKVAGPIGVSIIVFPMILLGIFYFWLAFQSDKQPVVINSEETNKNSETRKSGDKAEDREFTREDGIAFGLVIIFVAIIFASGNKIRSWIKAPSSLSSSSNGSVVNCFNCGGRGSYGDGIKCGDCGGSGRVSSPQNENIKREIYEDLNN